MIELNFSIDSLFLLPKALKLSFRQFYYHLQICLILQKKSFPKSIYDSFQGKPGDVNEYFKSFIKELKHCFTHGV